MEGRVRAKKGNTLPRHAVNPSLGARLAESLRLRSWEGVPLLSPQCHIQPISNGGCGRCPYPPYAQHGGGVGRISEAHPPFPGVKKEKVLVPGTLRWHRGGWVYRCETVTRLGRPTGMWEVSRSAGSAKGAGGCRAYRDVFMACLATVYPTGALHDKAPECSTRCFYTPSIKSARSCRRSAGCRLRPDRGRTGLR